MKKKIILLNISVVTVSLLVTFFAGISINKKSHYEEARQEIIKIAEIYKANYSENVTETAPEGVRLTVIGADGKVIKDSENSGITGENHLNREEVIAAASDNPKTVFRYSNTLKCDMAYYCVKVPVGESFVLLRVAIKVASVNEYVYSSVPALFAVAVGAICVSAIISILAGASLFKPLESIENNLEDVRKGVYKEKIIKTSDDGVNKILKNIDALSETLQKTIAEKNEEKNKLSYIISNVSDGILVLDGKGDVFLMNEIAEKIFGFNGLNKNFAVLTENDLFNKGVNGALKNKTPVTLDFSSGGKTYLTRIKSLSDGSVAIVMSDITELRNSEKTRREFFSNASHELKTPLTAIKGFNELVLLYTKEEKTKELSKKISDQTDRMIDLISDMLNLTKLEEKTPEKAEELSLKAVSEKVIEDLKPVALKKNVSLSVRGDGVIKIEESHAETLIKNLVENGIRYNCDGGNVEILIEENEKSVILNVKDDGCGIPEKDLPRIFERFYRVNDSRSRNTGGTGLGLAIVKHVAILYNAEITVKSKEGEGTVFTVIFKK